MKKSIEYYICSYYRLYDEWHETKRVMYNIRIEWSLGWFFLIGVWLLTTHTWKINIFGFDICVHWLKKNKKYWGKKQYKKEQQ